MQKKVGRDPGGTEKRGGDAGHGDATVGAGEREA